MKPAAALTFLFVSLVLAPVASAQDVAPPPRRWTLEIALDHGVMLDAPEGAPLQALPSGSLDVRFHAPIGLGGMVRVDAVQLALSRLALELGPAARVWLHRDGPRGLQLGGSLGLAVDLRFDGPRPGLLTSICVLDDTGRRCRGPYDGRVGPYGTVQLDYREHAFFVGIAVLARWLPHDLRGPQRDGEHASFSALLRAGGEIEL
ncbi:hypothetical protein [Sandaracinus amylolyticus]|uniref:hypothetical protein n=1 Tax=Sandaracinus amylolyticus TaxID=927083 RepID=UPI001F2184FD|nr:hypothetical protein [Sandaracinus amylolyticus]